MEWEQIHSQQENGKWHTLLEVLQRSTQQESQLLGTSYCNKQTGTIIL